MNDNIMIKRITIEGANEEDFAQKLSDEINKKMPEGYHHKETLKFSTSAEGFPEGNFSGRIWILIEKNK